MEIKHKITGKVLLEVKGDTLLCANLQDADLKYADLQGANLRYADLRGAKTAFCNVNFTKDEYRQAKQFAEGLR